ncbi:FAD-binding oxidoreductase [Aestuariivirga sp.]|uniref:FAD-binding oxidoreductase n=1 Tax=Aestuariivirga sp. TaxID=2650926 RepID=UPI0039E422A5
MTNTASPGSSALVDALISEFGNDLAVPAEALPRYSGDFTGDYHGTPLAVVRPRTTEEVSSVVRWCGARKVPIVPQGGNTGLVGAAIPSGAGNELVLSLERMKAIRKIDTLNGVAIVEAGCVLADFKASVEAEGAFFPLSIGSEGSCQIGGTIATNAGGINVVRYGMARNQILGIEAVLPDGSVFKHLRGLQKDNTGYDLKQLFIGSEGTLGIVTAAAVRLLPKITQLETLFVSTSSIESTVELFRRFRAEAGDLITAFELMMGSAVDRVCETEAGVRNPLESSYPSYAIVELSSAGGPPLRPWLKSALAHMIEDGIILDGAIAHGADQTANIWALRERIVESQARLGPYLRTDISTPVSAVAEFIRRATQLVEKISPGALPLAYGHVGDGNLHFNVMRSETLPIDAFLPLISEIEEALFLLVDELNGSISAEHGIGIAKRHAFESRLDPVARRLMTGLKQMLDPDNLLNPGRILPETWCKNVI